MCSLEKLVIDIMVKDMVDINAYWAKYQNFIASKNVVVPFYRSVSNGSALAAMLGF